MLKLRYYSERLPCPRGQQPLQSGLLCSPGGESLQDMGVWQEFLGLKDLSWGHLGNQETSNSPICDHHCRLPSSHWHWRKEKRVRLQIPHQNKAKSKREVFLGREENPHGRPPHGVGQCEVCGRSGGRAEAPKGSIVGCCFLSSQPFPLGFLTVLASVSPPPESLEGGLWRAQEQG